MKIATRTPFLALCACLSLGLAVGTGFGSPYDHEKDDGHEKKCDPEKQPNPGDPSEPPCNDCNATGSPVFLAGGDLALSFADLPIDAEIDFVISRYYHSTDDRTGLFGRGWTHTLEVRAIPWSDGELRGAVVRWIGGQLVRFTLQPDGKYAPPARSPIKLQSLPGGGYEIATNSGSSIFETNPNGDLLQIRDRNGNAVQLTLDPLSSCPQSIETAAGSVQILRGPTGHITSLQDPAGRTVHYDYDSDGRLVAVTDPGGGVWSYIYDSLSRLTQALDPLGRPTHVVEYHNDGKVRRIVNAEGDYTYSYAPGQTTKTDNGSGGIWIYGLDASGVVTAVTDPNGNVSSRLYDSQYNLVSSTDANGNTKTYAYDAESNLLSTTNALGASISYSYTGAGQVETVTDEDGVKTKFTYDASGNLKRVVEASGTAVKRVSVSQFDGKGNLISAIDPLGNQHAYTYDELGNVIESVDPTGAKTTFAYDLAGKLGQRTDALGGTSTFTYDGLGHVLTIVDPSGASWTYTYDEAGHLSSSTNPLGDKTIFESDAYGRLLMVTDPLGNSTINTYDLSGHLKSATDAAGNTTSYLYDSLGRLTSETNPVGGVTTYSHDAVGNLLSVTDPNGGKVSFSYDDDNKLVSTTLPSGLTKTFTYGADGLTSSVTDYAGSTTTFGYDPLDRVVEKKYQDGSIVSYSYDPTDNLVLALAPGHSWQATYDVRGNIVSEQYVELGKTIGHAYDALGRLASSVDPQGNLTQYKYNSRGLVRRIEHSMLGDTEYTYDEAGRRKSRTLPNGVRSLFAHDAAGHLTQLTHELGDGTPLLTFNYAPDVTGKWTGVVDAQGEHAYLFDEADELQSADHPVAGTLVDESYSYDLMFNRNSSHLSSVYQYDPDNRLVLDDSRSYEYDPNGNLTRWTDLASQDQTDFQYDFENRLVGAQASAGFSLDFEFDALGRRLRRDSSGTVRQFVYAGEDLVCEYDGSGNLLATFVFGPESDELLIQDRGGQIAFHLTDGLGSVALLVDGGGQELASYRYDSFGRLIERQGGFENAHTFTGRYWDSEIGLYHLRSRSYDPQIGRFVQPDPLGFGGGINRYAYVGNDPIDFRDPFGLYKYGNCCGASIQCEPGGNNCEKEPINETDSCCKEHDICLVGEAGWAKCTPGVIKCHQGIVDCLDAAKNPTGWWESTNKAIIKKAFQSLLSKCKVQQAVGNAVDTIKDLPKQILQDVLNGLGDALKEKAEETVSGIIKDLLNNPPIPHL